MPGGLTAEVLLDGDVVDQSVVWAALRADAAAGGSAVPDALSPVAWTVAMTSSDEEAGSLQWLIVAAIELERAISHVAWVRSVARLINWKPLIDACTHALAAIQISREVLPPDCTGEPWLRTAIGAPDIGAGQAAISDVVALVSASRTVQWRLRGRARVTGKAGA